MLRKKPNKKKKLSKSKSKPKKLATFNSSEFSLLEGKNYFSVCDLFKNDAIKKRNYINLARCNAAMPPKKNKSQKNLQSKKKGKSKPACKK